MKPDKKPRSDSKLDSMPEIQVMELRDKLLKGDSYQECLSWLLTEYGESSVPSALSAFYQRHCAPVIRERRQLSVVKAEALGDAMAADPVNWDTAIVERTKQMAFEFLNADQHDPDSVGKLLDAVVKARKQEFTEKIQTRKAEAEERKLQLLEAKARRIEATEEAIRKINQDNTLSEEQQRQAVLDKMDEFFGLKKGK